MHVYLKVALYSQTFGQFYYVHVYLKVALYSQKLLVSFSM